MGKSKEKKEDAILLLRNKYDCLLSIGENRYPQRSDFTETEVVLIKAFLGPWPRALEIAGIKPAKNDLPVAEYVHSTAHDKYRRIAPSRHTSADEN